MSHSSKFISHPLTEHQFDWRSTINSIRFASDEEEWIDSGYESEDIEDEDDDDELDIISRLMGRTKSPKYKIPAFGWLI